MTTPEEIRRWAMAWPEVEETSHFRFRSPVFKVRGRTFLGLQVHLGGLPPERIRSLVEEAWHQQAPRKLAAGRDGAARPGRGSGAGSAGSLLLASGVDDAVRRRRRPTGMILIGRGVDLEDTTYRVSGWVWVPGGLRA
jgi:hypothetical protein